jgi:hypothetical protein
MGFLDKRLNADASTEMGSKIGGLNPEVAMDGVRSLFDKSADAVVAVAEFAQLLPDSSKLVDFLSDKADDAGLLELCERLTNDEAALGAVWKQINTSDWEEFIVDDQPTDISPYQPVIDAAAADAALERALQAAAEYVFPKLYLFRALALGITATDEDWMVRAKINTFRNFFLRLAIPGGEYDKYISYYIIVTSEKDAWDEMRAGQNSKIGFLVDSVANLGAVKISSMFEAKFEKLIADKYRELTGSDAPLTAEERARGVGQEVGVGRDISQFTEDDLPAPPACSRCGRILPPLRRDWCMYCGQKT